MVPVHLKKGYSLRIAGAPSPQSAGLTKPTHVAALPERIPFVKPRLRVKVDDRVQVGSVLFEDKRNTEIQFLSPGGGTVVNIGLGPRRVIQEIVIELDDEASFREFQTFSESDLEAANGKDIVQAIIQGGLWPLIRMLPFRDWPDPQITPPGIFVTIGNLEPFHPRPETFLNGREDLFRFGVKILNRLANGQVFVAASQGDDFVLSEFEDLITHTYQGDYPAHDAGVLLYHTKSAPSDNRTWYIDAQDLLLLAELLRTGRYPTRRTVVLAGSMAIQSRHYETRIGVPLRHLMGDRTEEGDIRCIVGGILTGYTGSKDSYLGFFETGLNLLPAGNEREVLASFQPGFRKPSYSRTFLTVFNRGDFMMNCNIHGGVRACIACNHCPDVCPVDILPQLTYKSILVEEVEESLAHGLLDCVECGLCSYVCPSKIELFDTLRNAKAAYYKEQA